VSIGSFLFISLRSSRKSETVVEEIDECDYHQEEFLGILALARNAREVYDLSGRLTDLEDCIAYLRDALTVGPRDNSIRAEVLHTLAHDLYVYSLNAVLIDDPSLEADLETLSESINLHRQALVLLPARLNSDRPLYLTRLAIALRHRFTQTACKGDLEECISLHRKALSLRSPSHPDRSQSLLNLANALCTRFELLGNPDDLERALRFDREAVDLRPPGHPNRTAALMALGTDLSARYLKTSQLVDLGLAIEMEREAYYLNPTDSDIAHSLASLLVMRYHAIQDSVDFDDVTSICTKASESKDNTNGSAAALHTLAELYTIHFEHSGDPSYLMDAAKLCRRCLDLKQVEAIYFQVAHTFITRYRECQNCSDFNHAVTLCQEALHLCLPGHPYRATTLYTLAQGFKIAFEVEKQDTHLAQSLAYYAAAVRDASGSVRARFQYTQDWISLAEKTCQEESLSDGCAAAVQLFGRILHFDDHVDVRIGAAEWVSTTLLQVLTSAVTTQRSGAIELLDYARTLLLAMSHNPQCSCGLDDLSPTTRQKLYHISLQLEHSLSPIPFSTIRSLSANGTSCEDVIARRNSLVRKFDALIDEVRDYPGLDGLLKPTSYTALSNGWDYGFVVMLVSAARECHAFVIFPTSIEPLDIILPLSPTTVKTVADDFMAAAQSEDEGAYRSLLEVTWKGVVKPIIQKLILGVRRFYYIQAEIQNG
jgi:tetratricopeptide (TPR) repeat protein